MGRRSRQFVLHPYRLGLIRRAARASLSQRLRKASTFFTPLVSCRS